MGTELATMRLFTRRSANQAWKLVGAAEPAVVGKAGLGWGYSFLDIKQRDEPEKIEGDKRTPAGLFRIGVSFGFAPSRQLGYIELKGGESVRSTSATNRTGSTAQPDVRAAQDASGHAVAALPSSVMNWRRFIQSPRRLWRGAMLEFRG
jgi:hypothetical protein